MGKEVEAVISPSRGLIVRVADHSATIVKKRAGPRFVLLWLCQEGGVIFLVNFCGAGGY